MNNTFSWSKALGFGLIVWGISVLSLWLLSYTNLSELWTHALVAMIAGGTAYFSANLTEVGTTGKGFYYGASWVVLGLLLDLAITQNYDAHIFTTWQYWSGYALVLLAPLLEGTAESEAHSHA